ncbi:NADPH-dependent oxidoreductase [Mycolicibacterium sp. P1-18]|uniref:NADPH-dependent FMN reductase n=1 Tax=Mycolicibacterium sp. P1-18 TaxID=2024615 RepID=UPI0011F29EF8|nr:NAD(P)H-dependent oxidoreductase [Mycolicibacterium sp. P1-18]KAA0095966.1 NADPH-dependent oxidoreductase [Mycolicibacterium sp. P1-18]
MTKPVLQVVVASTRPGRVGRPVADWFAARATGHGGFDVEIVDLAEVNLPFFDEPRHPRLGDYEHDHTKAWSATVSRGDAYVFVTPEYNYGFNAVLKNALDFLSREWAFKPALIVSYGGVSAGTRAAQMLKQVLAALRMFVVGDVSIPFVTQFLGENGSIEANDVLDGSARTMLDELLRVATHTASMRTT